MKYFILGGGILVLIAIILIISLYDEDGIELGNSDGITSFRNALIEFILAPNYILQCKLTQVWLGEDTLTNQYGIITATGTNKIFDHDVFRPTIEFNFIEKEQGITFTNMRVDYYAACFTNNQQNTNTIDSINVKGRFLVDVKGNQDKSTTLGQISNDIALISKQDIAYSTNEINIGTYIGSYTLRNFDRVGSDLKNIRDNNDNAWMFITSKADLTFEIIFIDNSKQVSTTQRLAGESLVTTETNSMFHIVDDEFEISQNAGLSSQPIILEYLYKGSSGQYVRLDTFATSIDVNASPNDRRVTMIGVIRDWQLTEGLPTFTIIKHNGLIVTKTTPTSWYKSGDDGVFQAHYIIPTDSDAGVYKVEFRHQFRYQGDFETQQVSSKSFRVERPIQVQGNTQGNTQENTQGNSLGSNEIQNTNIQENNRCTGNGIQQFLNGCPSNINTNSNNEPDIQDAKTKLLYEILFADGSVNKGTTEQSVTLNEISKLTIVGNQGGEKKILNEIKVTGLFDIDGTFGLRNIQTETSQLKFDVSITLKGQTITLPERDKLNFEPIRVLCSSQVCAPLSLSLGQTILPARTIEAQIERSEAYLLIQNGETTPVTITIALKGTFEIRDTSTNIISSGQVDGMVFKWTFEYTKGAQQSEQREQKTDLIDVCDLNKIEECEIIDINTEENGDCKIADINGKIRTFTEAICNEIAQIANDIDNADIIGKYQREFIDNTGTPVILEFEKTATRILGQCKITQANCGNDTVLIIEDCTCASTGIAGNINTVEIDSGNGAICNQSLLPCANALDNYIFQQDNTTLIIFSFILIIIFIIIIIMIKRRRY